jgi:hypothetical protein
MIGSSFAQDLALADVRERLEAGELRYRAEHSE